MGTKESPFIPDVENVRFSDIIGIWEEITHPEENSSILHPGQLQESQTNLIYILTDRVFYCKKNGIAYQGEWELKEIQEKGHKYFRIIVNEQCGYDILEIDYNRLCLFDGARKLKLRRVHQ